jgi:hypothetical protein
VVDARNERGIGRYAVLDEEHEINEILDPGRLAGFVETSQGMKLLGILLPQIDHPDGSGRDPSEVQNIRQLALLHSADFLWAGYNIDLQVGELAPSEMALHRKAPCGAPICVIA